MLATISGCMYGLLGYFGVHLMQSGLSVYTMLFWRFLIASVLVFFAMFFVSKIKWLSFADSSKIFFYGAAFYSASAIIYFFASKLIGTGLAMVLFFTYPAFVMFINWLLFRMVPTKLALLAVIIIIMGLFLLAELQGGATSLYGLGLAILPALAYALYIVFSKKIDAPPLISTLIVSLGCMLTCLVAALAEGSFGMPTTLNAWSNMLGISVICTAVPILFFLESLKTISASQASILSVTEPVFVVIVGLLFLGEQVSLQQFIGIAVVLSGALITVLSSEKS